VRLLRAYLGVQAVHESVVLVVEGHDERIAFRHDLDAAVLGDELAQHLIVDEDGLLHHRRVPLPHRSAALHVCAHERHLTPACHLCLSLV
jgi:hypothetical protein